MNPSDLAIIALAVNGALSTTALVYVVRRVSPWPKPPVQPQRPAAAAPSPAANGTEPARSIP